LPGIGSSVVLRLSAETDHVAAAILHLPQQRRGTGPFACPAGPPCSVAPGRARSSSNPRLTGVWFRSSRRPKRSRPCARTPSVDTAFGKNQVLPASAASGVCDLFGVELAGRPPMRVQHPLRVPRSRNRGAFAFATLFRKVSWMPVRVGEAFRRPRRNRGFRSPSRRRSRRPLAAANRELPYWVER